MKLSPQNPVGLTWSSAPSPLRADGTVDPAGVAHFYNQTQTNEQTLADRISQQSGARDIARDAQLYAMVAILGLAVLALWQALAIRRVRRELSRLTAPPVRGITDRTGASS